jgi:hypothetical protein
VRIKAAICSSQVIWVFGWGGRGGGGTTPIGRIKIAQQLLVLGVDPGFGPVGNG